MEQQSLKRQISHNTRMRQDSKMGEEEWIQEKEVIYEDIIEKIQESYGISQYI